jgi:hypothetical protein
VGYLSKIKLAITAVWQIVTLLKEADEAVAKKYSDAWWRQLRKSLELRVYELYERRDKGLLKYLQSDDQLLRGPLILMKSERLTDIYQSHDDPTLKRRAVSKLKAKPVVTQY